MIKVVTDFPLAYRSADHTYPDGIYLDNNLNKSFVRQLEFFFKNRKINFMDIGCAGGELVCEMHRRGHKSIGLEGSDQCLIVRSEMVKEVGQEPLGKNNWSQLYNKNLFTCDVTKPFDIYDNQIPMLFDAITSFDVVEHFEPSDQSQFIQNVKKHLKNDGVFFASIAMFSCKKTKGAIDIEYHKSLFPVEWWRNKFQENGMEENVYPLKDTNRPYKPLETYVCAWKKKL